MNDLHRMTIGVIGTLSAWTLETYASAAALVASIATAVFMIVSTVEKIRRK